MELGLSADEEARRFDPMASQEERRELIGELGEFHPPDASISQVASKMLRHGTCYRKFCMSELGYTPMTEVYDVARDFRANLDRIRRHDERGGVSPRSLISFVRAGKGRHFYF